MYDTLSGIFVLCFVTFYLVFYTAFILWALKPRLMPALRKHIVPIFRRFLELPLFFQRQSGAIGLTADIQRRRQGERLPNTHGLTKG